VLLSIKCWLLRAVHAGGNGGINEYPTTLNYEIHGITVWCVLDCDEVGVATWDAVEGAWIDDITMDGCSHSGTIRIVCGPVIPEPPPCTGTSDWTGSLNDITPCTNPSDPGADDHIFDFARHVERRLRM